MLHEGVGEYLHDNDTLHINARLTMQMPITKSHSELGLEAPDSSHTRMQEDADPILDPSAFSRPLNHPRNPHYLNLEPFPSPE